MHGLNVRLQRHTNASRYFWSIGGRLKLLKFIITYLYYTKYNEIECFIQLYKNVFYVQNHTKDWKQMDMYFKFSFIVRFYRAKF